MDIRCNIFPNGRNDFKTEISKTCLTIKINNRYDENVDLKAILLFWKKNLKCNTSLYEAHINKTRMVTGEVVSAYEKYFLKYPININISCLHLIDVHKT